MRTKILIILSLCFLLLRSSIAQTPYVYQQPQALDDGWRVNHLSVLDIDTSLFYACMNSLPKAKKHKLHSMLLIQEGNLVFEEYFGKYTAETLHDLRSTTKSITSLLVGIAIDKGYIKSVEDPIFDYLPNYTSHANVHPHKREIQIKHLLTMSSGLACNDWEKSSPGQEDKMYKVRDWLQYVVDLPQERSPGDSSFYCTGGVVLLGEILRNASGVRLDTFAQKHLFGPLGISSVQWTYFDKQRKVDAGGHLFLRPRDLAKIGQLVLQKGKWGGTQVVSETWIAQATMSQIHIGHVDYGFLWWLFPFSFQGRTLIAKVATGNGGQYLFVFPDLALVAIFTGGNYNSPQAQFPFNILQKIILPSLNKNP